MQEQEEISPNYLLAPSLEFYMQFGVTNPNLNEIGRILWCPMKYEIRAK